MERSAMEYAFCAIWARYQKSNQESVTLEQLKSWAIDKGLCVTGIERKEIGAFNKTDCIVIHAKEGSACLPVTTDKSKETWRERQDHSNQTAEEWKKLEWFSPFWVSGRDARKILQDAKLRSASEAIEMFNYHTSTIYTLSFEAVCIEQIMGSAKCLIDIRPLAREAYLAFYAGYKSASIAALIPAIEGAITRILPKEMQSLATLEKVNRVVEGPSSMPQRFTMRVCGRPPAIKASIICFVWTNGYLHLKLFDDGCKTHSSKVPTSTQVPQI